MLEAPQRVEHNWLVTNEDVERVMKMLIVEEDGKELRSKELRSKVRELKVATR